MFRLIGIVVSIGLADSLNPTTIAPALYLACGEQARSRVLQFTVGVFLVYLLGGLLIALGPGQLLLAIVPHPHARARHIIEISVGVAMVVASILLWRHRRRLSQRELPKVSTHGRSSAILGATITAVELPTAFPYFAAIATVVGSGVGPPRQIALIVLFNICFVLPLVAIIVTLWVAGDRAAQVLGNARDFLQRRWPVLLSVVLGLAGIITLLLGVTAVTSTNHTRFGRFMRRFHRILHP